MATADGSYIWRCARKYNLLEQRRGLQADSAHEKLAAKLEILACLDIKDHKENTSPASEI